MPLAPWVTITDLPTPRPDLPGGDEEWATLAAEAGQVLYVLSGRRWAGARTRVVDVVALHGERWAELSTSPEWWWDGSWGACTFGVSVVGGEIINHRACTCPTMVRLPYAPVTSVTEVRVGGQVRAPSSYRPAEGRWLEDLTGRGWDTCTGLVVTYVAGVDPPAVARDLAAQLALHLGYARAGDARCRLPGNTTSITRQGITQSFIPASDLINAGRTGLDEVDRWLAVVNPTNRRHRPSSWSPDTHQRTVTHAEEGSP